MLESAGSFSVEFWLRFDAKSAPDIDMFMGLINVSKQNEGFQYHFYYQYSSPTVSSEFNLLDFVYDGSANDFFVSWTKFRIDYTYDDSSGITFLQEVFINDTAHSDSPTTVASTTQLGDALTLVIGNSYPSSSSTLSKR
jgi:hypothetical protein